MKPTALPAETPALWISLLEHVSLLLNYSSCEQSTAESKGQAPSHTSRSS